jgi:hypothetical protein
VAHPTTSAKDTAIIAVAANAFFIPVPLPSPKARLGEPRLESYNATTVANSGY